MNLSIRTIKTDHLPYLALFKCYTTKICKRTYGYVKDYSNEYYEIHSNHHNSKVAIEPSCGDSYVGKLITPDQNLCLTSNSLGTLTNSESYVMFNGNGSVFSQEQYINIYISSSTNAFYHDKFVDGRFIYYLKSFNFFFKKNYYYFIYFFTFSFWYKLKSNLIIKLEN